jgi:hypothetical protein
VLFASLAFEPSAVFFYVKGSREAAYPDDLHAVPLDSCANLVSNLREVEGAVGEGIKLKMENQISKSRRKKP